jgi:hypothetical protein
MLGQRSKGAETLEMDESHRVGVEAHSIMDPMAIRPLRPGLDAGTKGASVSGRTCVAGDMPV